MKRVLVVQQFVAPGSAQDQQRGDMYAPVYRGNGFEPAYIGRRPAYARRLQRIPKRWARAVRESITYKIWYRALDRGVRVVNDARVLRKARSSDVVHLIKVNSVELVRKLRQQTKARLVFDLADALWLPTHADDYRDVKEILTMVDAVTCDNTFGLAYAQRFNPSVHLWPPASHVEMFDARRDHVHRKDSRIVLGWVGSAGTASSLHLILESLEDVAKQYPNVHLRLLGVAPYHDLVRRFEKLSWSCVPAYTREEMVEEMLGFDVGLFPMYDLEESTTHGITKALIYMGAGAAVIASPIGACRDLIIDGKNGFLAEGRSQWTQRLNELVRDPGLRRRLADGGLATVRADYTLERCFASMRAALGDA